MSVTPDDGPAGAGSGTGPAGAATGTGVAGRAGEVPVAGDAGLVRAAGRAGAGRAAGAGTCPEPASADTALVAARATELAGDGSVIDAAGGLVEPLEVLASAGWERSSSVRMRVPKSTNRNSAIGLITSHTVRLSGPGFSICPLEKSE